MNIFKKFWKNFVTGNAQEQETEFLPAILEVTETPPSPTGRLVMWSIMGMLVIAILWGFFGTINEVAVAPGKVIPVGQIKTVQVKNKGVIKEIYVQEGDHVEAGQKIVVLDPTSTDADKDSLAKRAAYYKLDIQRLEAEMNGTGFVPSADPNLQTSDISAEQSLYMSRTAQHSSEVEAARKAIDQKQAALQEERTNLDKFNSMLEVAREKESRLEALVSENAVSEFQLLEQRSQRINIEKTAAAQAGAIAKAEGELAEAKSKLDTVDASYKKDIMASLVESRKQYYAATEELVKADENQRLAIITAPCAGRVYNLSVHTVGGVVTDAQPLMYIVPEDAELALEVWASNDDIGFIKNGMEAEVKVDTFNFQKFGMVNAVVDEIAANAYDDKADHEKNQRYRLLLKMENDSLDVMGEDKKLLPGMHVNAEIKTREKRIIDFFMDPFKKYTSEALRER